MLCGIPAAGAPAPCDRGPNVLDEWRGFDSRHPEFRRPTLIAVDPSGSVYLLDQELYLIRQFSALGAFQKTWELPGEEHASFMTAMAASKKFLYVSDGSVIYQFFPDGSVGIWNRASCPNGLVVDRKGNVFVAAARTRSWNGYHDMFPMPNRPRKPPKTRNLPVRSAAGEAEGIWKLSSVGEVLDHWDLPSWPLAMAEDGILYAVEPDSGGEMLRIAPSGVTRIPCHLSLDPARPLRSIAVSQEGHLFVSELKDVVEADLQGNVLRRWCELGPGRDPLDRPTGCAVDGKGNLYVTDPYKHRVLKFDLAKH